MVTDVENNNGLPLTVYRSINNLVINIAVNKEVKIPINKVVANPLIGPVPKTSKIIPVKAVVIFASKIEESALLKPSLIASFCAFPLYNSSLIR